MEDLVVMVLLDSRTIRRSAGPYLGENGATIVFTSNSEADRPQRDPRGFVVGGAYCLPPSEKAKTLDRRFSNLHSSRTHEAQQFVKVEMCRYFSQT